MRSGPPGLEPEAEEGFARSGLDCRRVARVNAVSMRPDGVPFGVAALLCDTMLM